MQRFSKKIEFKKKDLKNTNLNFRPKILAALFANLVVFFIYAYCFWLVQNERELYLSYVIEDGFVEWATTWAFLIASFGSMIGVFRGYFQLKEFQWFYLGLSIFCFMVAMEEISWGQRILGYQAPNYFLENNFQQELTVHNMVSEFFRDTVIQIIVLGYGVILPILMVIPRVRGLLCALRVVVPPLWLIPAFFSVFCIYQFPRWVASDEVIELMMGFSFLFTILFRLWDFILIKDESRIAWQFTSILLVVLLLIGLGLGTAHWSSYRAENNPILKDVSYKELEAVKSDFIWKTNQQGYSPFKNYFNLRLYTAVESYDFDWMYEGKFAGLTEQGLPKDRASFFLDPWNMPYWVMFKLNKDNGRKRLVIYSFGPNRKRDSDDWALKGDDIGLVLLDTDLN